LCEGVRQVARRDGQRLIDAVARATRTPQRSPSEMDKNSIAIGAGNGAVREVKEWQAIMDHLRNLPVKNKGELPVIPVDERAAEVRGIEVG
jgi:hypothetical protein